MKLNYSNKSYTYFVYAKVKNRKMQIPTRRLILGTNISFKSVNLLYVHNVYQNKRLT